MHTKHEKYTLNQGSILCTGGANALKVNLLRAEIPGPDTISDARLREALNVNTQFSEVSDVSSMGHFVDLGQENTSVYAPSPEGPVTQLPDAVRRVVLHALLQHARLHLDRSPTRSATFDKYGPVFLHSLSLEVGRRGSGGGLHANLECILKTEPSVRTMCS